MPLALYRRHRRDCKAGHPEELRTSEYDERKKGWKRCECPIVCSGTLAKHFQRRNTAQWEWDSAKELLCRWEGAGSWTAEQPSPPPPVPEPVAIVVPAGRTTIARATAAYEAEFELSLQHSAQVSVLLGNFVLGEIRLQPRTEATRKRSGCGLPESMRRSEHGFVDEIPRLAVNATDSAMNRRCASAVRPAQFPAP